MTTLRRASASSGRCVLMLLLTLALTTGCALHWAPAALAHDELVGTQPSDGDTLTAAPDVLVLTFSAEVAELGTEVVVTGPEGTVTEGTPQVAGRQVLQPLDVDAGAGPYRVVWRVTSADGHPISGDLGYTVAPVATSAPTGASATSTPIAPAPTSAPAQSGESTATADAAARTDAVLKDGAEAVSGGLAPWMWIVIAVALATLAALGVTAARRR